MFRVAFFCEDRKLAEALRSITGLAVGNPEVQPVVNAVPTPTGVKAASNGSLVERFAAILTKQKVAEFHASQVKGFAKAVGIAPSSGSYLMKKAVQARLLKTTGKGSGMRYTVVRP